MQSLARPLLAAVGHVAVSVGQITIKELYTGRQTETPPEIPSGSLIDQAA